MAAYVAQLGNKLTDQTNFQILQAYPEQLSSNDIFDGCAKIVVAEPFYEKLDEYPIIECLNFFYQIKGLKHRGLIADNAITVPSMSRIMVTAIECFNLRQAHQHLNEECSNFSHAAIDKFRGNDVDLNLPVWQYNYRPLTDAFEVSKIVFGKTSIEHKGKVSKKFNATGICHGFIVSVEHVNTLEETLSSLCDYKKQHVQLLTSPVKVGITDVCRCLIEFDSNSEDFVFSGDVELGSRH